MSTTVRAAAAEIRLLSSRGRLISWIALLGSAALIVFGIVANRLFSQTLWSHSGLFQLAIFAVAYSVWSALWIWAAPQWFRPATCIAALAFILIAAGPVACGAVLLMLASAFVTGSLICREAAGARSLRLLAGLAVLMAADAVLVHFPVNFRSVYAAMLLAPIVIWPRVSTGCVRETFDLLRPRRELRRAEVAALGMLFFALACHLLASLQPEIGADALAVHLVPAGWVAAHHYWPFDAARISWAVMPLGADWLNTIAYLTGGEPASHLLNFLFLTIIAAMICTTVRAGSGRATAVFLSAIFVSTPLVRLVTGSLFVENVWAAMLIGCIIALARYREQGETRALFAAALFCGCAAATKFGSVAFLVCLAPFAIHTVAGRSKLDKNTIRHVLCAAGVALAIGSATYVFAWLRTGNPIFPYENNVFHSRFFDDAKPFVDVRYATPLNARTPYDALFHTRRYLEGQDGALGFQYPILIALALVAPWGSRYRWLRTLCLVTASGSAVLIFRSLAYVRYLYPSLPLFTMAAGFALGEFLPVTPRLFKTTICLLSAVFILNIYFLPSSGFFHPELFVNPFDPNAAKSRILAGAPERLLIDYVNRHHPGEPVALFDTEAVAGLEAPSYLLSWHTQPYLNRAQAAPGPVAYGRLAIELGIRDFIAPSAWATPESSSPIGRFLERFTAPEASAGRFQLRRLAADVPAEILRQPVEPAMPACEPNMVDDQSGAVRYRGKWLRIDHFGNACSRTLTYSDEQAAELEFRFSGTSVDYIATEAFNRGIADVTIDGKPARSLDLFAPAIVWRTHHEFAHLSPGDHTIRIRVAGRKREASQGLTVDLDGFSVR